MTTTTSHSVSFWSCCVNIRRTICAIGTLWFGLMICGPIPDAVALPTADELLKQLNISARDQQGIREGKIVTWTASEGSDRELAFGMALLAKTKGENIVQLFREASAFQTIEAGLTAHGKITGGGVLDDFADVRLEPNGEDEALRYLKAEPGDVLNLGAEELAAYRTLKSAVKGGAVPVQRVEGLIRQGLLARYQAYKTKGLAGIAPYERKSKHRLLAGDELTLATKQAKLVAKYLPSVYDAMSNYPVVKTKEGEAVEEQYYWLNVELSGRPLYVLSHRMLFRVGEAYAVLDRHFYSSHDYNCLQQGLVALPSDDGMLITYLRRVSTDQVAGFGSKVKHPLARALMVSPIKGLLEALRAKAETQ
jgi:hypothetical protein